MDLYFPAISLLAFLSGSCIGFYCAVSQHVRQAAREGEAERYPAGRAHRLW